MTDLVIGANGMIGSALMSYIDAVGTFHKYKNNLIEGRQKEFLDITDKHGVESVFEKHKPKRVFLVAGITNVDSCELLESDAVNRTGACNIISNCDVHGAQLIFFSSSYVFDGNSSVPYKPKDATSPINRHGRQKEYIEEILLSREGIQYLIIRTVSVFGKGNNFVSQIAEAVRRNKRIQVPTDQIVSPIHAPDLAKTVVHLSDRYSGDIFHVAGDRHLSYYDFAVQIAYKLGCKNPHDLIVKMKLEDMEYLAQRPLNASLDCKTLGMYAIGAPSLKKGLDGFLDS